VDQPADNARALAAEVLNEVENAILDLIAAGSGRLLIEVRSTSRDRRRLLVTRGTTTCLTVPVVDLGAEAQTRLERRGYRAEEADRPGPAPAASEPRPRRYLDTSAVAGRYGVGEGAVRQRLRRGQLPPPILLGRRRLWDERDLDRWDDAHKAPARPANQRPPT